MEAKDSERKEKSSILKEGELLMKSGVLKKWRARFVVLNREMLCIFRKEKDESKGRMAQDRIFVLDITSLDDYDSKKMKNCFTVLADGRSHIFSCPSDTDRSMWKRMIELAQEGERREEVNDPKKSTKLASSLKRLTIHRKIGQGLGCTIKNVGGVIFVNRILEEGPVSTTGVLRPGDQIIDINGIPVSNLAVSDISEIIKSSPEIVVCTVKPVTSDKIYETDLEHNTSEYAVLDLEALNKVVDNGQTEEETEDKESTHATDKDSISKNDQQSDSVPERPPKKAVAIPREDEKYADLNFDVTPDPGPRNCAKSDAPQYPQPIKKSPRSERSSCSNEHEKGLQYAYIQLDFGEGKAKKENGDEQLLTKRKKPKTPPHEKRTYCEENFSSPV